MEPPPDALPEKEMPEIDGVAAMYWQHFSELQTERPLGAMGGAGSIPWSSIDRYAERFGYDEEGYLDFLEIIRFLDGLWLKNMQDKQEKEKRKKPAKSSPSPRRR
jgi:hypothetical protein